MSAETLLPLVLTYGYVLLFGLLVLDSAGLPLAGELVLIGLGALVRSEGFELATAVAVAATATLAGHSIGYWAGRLGGGRMRLRSRACPGPMTQVFSRFLIGLRVAVAPLVGAGGVSFPRFLALDAAGALLWVGAFMAVGYTGGASLDTALDALAAARVAIPAVVGAIALALALRAGSTIWGAPGAPQAPQPPR